VEEFSRSKAASDGRQAYCKACVNARYNAVYSKAQQEKRLADPEKMLMHQRAVRRRHLMRRYGVTPEWYDAKLLEQSGRCDLCMEPITPDRWLAVDHCHVGGHPRGLLCNACNTALERADAHPGWLERAAAYLR
jgi:hypothetical protein